MHHYKVTASSCAFYATLEVVAETKEEADRLFREALDSQEWLDAAREEAEMSDYAGAGMTLDDAIAVHRYGYGSIDDIEQENIDPLTGEIESLDYLAERHRVPHVVRTTDSGGNG